MYEEVGQEAVPDTSLKALFTSACVLNHSLVARSCPVSEFCLTGAVQKPLKFSQEAEGEPELHLIIKLNGVLGWVTSGVLYKVIDEFLGTQVVN